MQRHIMDFPGGSDGKASTYNMGDRGSVPESGRSPGEGNGNPLQYSCLENPMGSEAWQATVHGVTKSQTRLSDFTFTFLASSARGQTEETRRSIVSPQLKQTMLQKVNHNEKAES